MLDKKYLFPEDAVRLIFKHITQRSLSSEIVPIEEAYSRVTAEDIISPEDLPGFNRSTVDGFAVKASDTFGAKESSPAYLKIKADIPMGAIPDFSLSNGEAASIATGGMLPEGADAVVMVEHVNTVSDDLIEVLKAVSPGENVIFLDEDAKKGETIIKAGHRLKPQDIGALAGLGIKDVKVIRKPVISIILTGDEIMPHTEKVTPGKVRDVNSFTLAGLCYENGAIPLKMGIIKDDYNEIKKAVTKAYELSDIVLITGGTSAGTKDLTAKIINEIGLPGVLFHGASIKPGKPIIGGVCNGKPVFGFPAPSIARHFHRGPLMHSAAAAYPSWPVLAAPDPAPSRPLLGIDVPCPPAGRLRYNGRTGGRQVRNKYGAVLKGIRTKSRWRSTTWTSSQLTFGPASMPPSTRTPTR